MPIRHNHQGKLVLVVQDDADLRSLLCDVVRELELQVAEATDGNGAIQQMMDREPHVVLTDLRIPGGGFEYVRTDLAGRSPGHYLCSGASGARESPDPSGCL